MDTIGGKHPFVFRNGNVNYKEFPISGLISLVSDPNERFMKGVQTGNLTALRTDTPALEAPDKVEGMLTADNI
jgi:hypothetical protein